MNRSVRWMAVAVFGAALTTATLALGRPVANTECCVCEDDCPTEGTRQCFTFVLTETEAFDASQGACVDACEAIGCGATTQCLLVPSCADEPICSEVLNGGCADGLDNNDDGLVDCLDPQCSGSPSCPTAVPLLSPWATTVAALLLLACGWAWMRTRHSQPVQ